VTDRHHYSAAIVEVDGVAWVVSYLFKGRFEGRGTGHVVAIGTDAEQAAREWMNDHRNSGDLAVTGLFRAGIIAARSALESSTDGASDD
jgi:hypothetical protein